jgi:predicted RNA-binding protein YlqC (UPF0109 family)
LGRRGIELAVEVQEGQTVDHGPEGCRQGVRVDTVEGAPDKRADVFGDGGGRGDPLTAVTVTRIAEHRPEKRPVFKRELDVGDGDGGKVLGSRGRGVRSTQIARKLVVALGCYGGDERIAVGIVPIGGARGHARSACHRAYRKTRGAVVLKQFHCRAQACGAQIAMVVPGARGWHESHSLDVDTAYTLT